MQLIYSKKPTHDYLIIDNWYSKEEEECVWKELDFYQTFQLEKAEETVVAKKLDGEPLGKHFRIPLDKIYNKSTNFYSHILKLSSKIQTKEFYEKLLEVNPTYGRNFSVTNYDYNLISYYENTHYYEPHIDAFLWTMLIWFYKEPKKFEGGELLFTEKEIKIDLKHNRMILFPSHFLHEVKPIKMKEEFDKGYGRYSITKFITYR
jgi:Rps23 Pro-64 3,4-dihydroxylase Tpa1-like proline 4-hydroxylase